MVIESLSGDRMERGASNKRLNTFRAHLDAIFNLHSTAQLVFIKVVQQCNKSVLIIPSSTHLAREARLE